MPKYCLLSVIALLALAANATAELKDPTRPSYVIDSGEPGATYGALRVNAIFISGERRVAIVNGQRLRVGQVVNGATISQIEQDHVNFVRGDEVFAVSLISGSSRQ